MPLTFDPEWEYREEDPEILEAVYLNGFPASVGTGMNATNRGERPDLASFGMQPTGTDLVARTRLAPYRGEVYRHTHYRFCANPECGMRFEVKASGAQRFCCLDCYSRPRVPVPCNTCGGTFLRPHGYRGVKCHRCRNTYWLKLRTCKRCEKEFQPTRRLQQYCNMKCRGKVAGMQKLQPKTCAWCPNVFTPKRSARIYCSRSCARFAQHNRG